MTALATNTTGPATNVTGPATRAVVSGKANGAIGSGGLLRLSALPIEAWLDAGSPALFDRLRLLDAQKSRLERRARGAALELGNRVVPHDDLAAADRSLVLSVRRSLHGGSVPGSTEDAIAVVRRLLPADPLVRRLRGLVTAGAALEQARSEIDGRVDEEERRLLAAAWPLLLDYPSGRAAVEAGDLTGCADIAARVAAGEPWTTKRMRQRGDYLWRIVTRAATRATPRGWLAQVAPLGVRTGPGFDGSGVLRVGAVFAVDHNENLDRRRAREVTRGMLLTDASVTVAVAPLAWSTTDHLVVWTLDGEYRDELSERRLRLTPALAAILAELGAGARPVHQVLDAVAAGDDDARERLAGLLSHLVSTGAVQVGVPPRRTLVDWQPMSPQRSWPTLARDRIEPDGYVDVYRMAATDLSTGYAHRVAGLVGLARRTMALVDDDGQDPPVFPPTLGEAPRPLLELVGECVRERVEVGRRPSHHHDWPRVRHVDSGYARLSRWLTGQMDSARVLDLDRATLDALGAPDEPLDWPVDCMLRPLRGPGTTVGVLEQIAPAGVLDARFAPALTDLGPRPAQFVAYQRFLDQFAGHTGRPMVEILVPPLSSRAANAVRRPGYTPLWTGDPDRAGFVDSGPGSYLPLERITLRRAGDQVVAEVAGQPIWPVSHTTRLMAPPWDTVTALLLLASPQPDRERWRSLRYSLPAWPRRRSVPRITVDGGLILTPAQWRVRLAELWHTTDRVTDKLIALQRLRRRHRMPRLVTVVADVHHDPIAVDLDSILGLRVFDRFIQQGRPVLLVRELLAEPDRLPVIDEAAGGRACLAELLLRLPVATPADVFARQIGDGWAARLTAQTAVTTRTNRPASDPQRPERTLT